MAKMMDLTGHVYGDLAVVSFGEMRGRRSFWKCRCACGNEKVVGLGNLRGGITKSCGCSKRSWGDGKKDRRNCISCGMAKTKHEFPVREGRYARKCCACDGEYQARRVKVIQGYRAKARTANAQARNEALSHYGRKCACCGETTEVFLCFDHINGGGSQHKKERTRDGATNLPVWLKKNGFPAGFQVLCNNCNWAKHLNGFCSHQVGGAVAALSFGA